MSVSQPPSISTFPPLLEPPDQPRVEIAPSGNTFGAKRALGITCAYIAAYHGIPCWIAVAAWIGAFIQQAGIPNVGAPALSRTLLLSLLSMPIASALAFNLARESFPKDASAEFKRTLGLVPARWSHVRASFGIGIVLCIGIASVIAVYFPPRADQLPWVQKVAAKPGWPRHVFAVMAVLAAPLAEELIFRGVLFSGLRRAMPLWAAALITSVAFAAVHLTNYPHPYWAAIGAIFTIGLAMQTARILTGSLVPGIAMHVAYNSLPVLALYLVK